MKQAKQVTADKMDQSDGETNIAAQRQVYFFSFSFFLANFSFSFYFFSFCALSFLFPYSPLCFWIMLPLNHSSTNHTYYCLDLLLDLLYTLLYTHIHTSTYISILPSFHLCIDHNFLTFMLLLSLETLFLSLHLLVLALICTICFLLCQLAAVYFCSSSSPIYSSEEFHSQI